MRLTVWKGEQNTPVPEAGTGAFPEDYPILIFLLISLICFFILEYWEIQMIA